VLLAQYAIAPTIAPPDPSSAVPAGHMCPGGPSQFPEPWRFVQRRQFLACGPLPGRSACVHRNDIFV